MRAKNPSGIIMRIAIILLCLVLFSAHLASGMFARYTISTGDSSLARVAKFGLNVVDVTQSSMTQDGQYTTFVCNVSNASELSFTYDVIISFDNYRSFDPADIINSVTITGFNGTVEKSDDDKTYTFKNVGLISSSVDQFSFSFVVDSKHYIAKTSTDNSGGWLTLMPYPMKVMVDATQVD